MSITSILALLDGGSGSEAIVRTAIDLGRGFDAHVECLYVELPLHSAIPAFSEGMTGGMLDELIRANKEAADQRKLHLDGLFQHLCGDRDITVIDPDGDTSSGAFAVARRDVVGHINREIAERGRLHDLIVVGPPAEETGGVDSAALEAALFDTGRPVLMANGDTSHIIGAKVTLAWDGSREAALAADLSLPILERAASVEVLTVTDAGRGADPAELARFLKRHDIDCTTRLLSAGGRNVADLLVEASRRDGDGLLIMGAFGHSPIGEFIFGGVTRGAMTAASVPLLMAH